MSKGNVNTYGNKKSNMPYQQSVLLILGAIEKLSSSSSTALAQESTLISVLNAIVTSHQDIEILLVRDTVTLIVYQQITNYQSGVPVVTYKDVNGNPFVPVNPMEYLDPSAVMNLMLTELIAINASTTSIDTKVTGLATEVTLAALLTAFGVEDFASETTLALVNSNIVLGNITLNAIDTVLDTIKVDTGLIQGYLAPVVRTPGIQRITSVTSGNIAAGSRSASFYNASLTGVVTISGVALKPGEQISWSAGAEEDNLSQINWSTADPSPDLLITTLV